MLIHCCYKCQLVCGGNARARARSRPARQSQVTSSTRVLGQPERREAGSQSARLSSFIARSFIRPGLPAASLCLRGWALKSQESHISSPLLSVFGNFSALLNQDCSLSIHAPCLIVLIIIVIILFLDQACVHNLRRVICSWRATSKQPSLLHISRP